MSDVIETKLDAETPNDIPEAKTIAPVITNSPELDENGISKNYKGKHPKTQEELAAIRAERRARRLPDNVQRHKELCKELNETYAKKNEAYGNSFHKTFTELGLISSITRMSDKWNRLVNLASHPERNKIEDESLVDTLKDLACYSLMTVMELELKDKKNE